MFQKTKQNALLANLCSITKAFNCISVFQDGRTLRYIFSMFCLFYELPAYSTATVQRYPQNIIFKAFNLYNL